MERKKMLPGVVGYVVKKDDTLWGIAKQYYTTVPRIMAINELDTENVTPGDRLVIVKE
jgi:LysM repeat protein